MITAPKWPPIQCTPTWPTAKVTLWTALYPLARKNDTADVGQPPLPRGPGCPDRLESLSYIPGASPNCASDNDTDVGQPPLPRGPGCPDRPESLSYIPGAPPNCASDNDTADVSGDSRNQVHRAAPGQAGSARLCPVVALQLAQGCSTGLRPRAGGAERRVWRGRDRTHMISDLTLLEHRHRQVAACCAPYH